MNKRKSRFLSTDEILRLLNYLTNENHRLIVLLMMDCGLRSTECVKLKYSNLDLKCRTLFIKNLYTENNNSGRCIPISPRLYRELGNFIFAKNKNFNTREDDWLFPSKATGSHISYKAVNLFLLKVSKELEMNHLRPLSLRQTFVIQQHFAGVNFREIKAMLGYSQHDSLTRFRRLVSEPVKRNIETSRWKTVLSALTFNHWPYKPKKSIDIVFKEGAKASVGRNKEIAKLNDLAYRQINCVIIGPIGVGKSHLLEKFEEYVEHSNLIKILKLDDANVLKSTLAQMLIYILKTDQQGVYEFLFPGYDDTKAVIKVSRENSMHIAKEIIKLTEKKQYTLLIDNVDRISPSSAKILELFKDHFTIVTTAREIPVSRSSFIWNFEIMRLEPLKREFALELIHNLSIGMEAEDLQLYKSHIYEQTNGNPRAITEMIERYRKEPVLTNEVVRSIFHTGALPEYDCTFLILLFLACVACLRYLNHEVQNASFRVLGGIALVFLFITRYFFKSSRKKNV